MLKKIYLSLMLAFISCSSWLPATIPYSLQPLFDLEPISTGFNPTNYWDSMQWQKSETLFDFTSDKDVKAVEQGYRQFCEKFNELPPQNYLVAPTQFSIPPIIHLIWLGSEIPPQVNLTFESWKKHHPNWEIKIWTDEKVALFDWSCNRIKRAFEQADTWAEKADILRLEVLYKFGGVYSDADVVCLNAFHDLIVQDIGFFSCFEFNYIGKHYGKPFFVGSAVMGSAKNGCVVKYCLDHLLTAAEAPTLGIIKRTGPGLVSQACETILSSKEEKILILPCSYFYPLPWKKREVDSESVLNYVRPESLAIHLWDGSWCPKREEKNK